MSIGRHVFGLRARGRRRAQLADHLDADLSVPALARRAAMSPRNFARVFARAIGATPARHVEQLRIEAARRMLEDSKATIDQIATRAGFGTREQMRRAFQRTLRIAPAEYRERFTA